MGKMLNLTTEEQREAYLEARELVQEDADEDLIGAERAVLGRAAGTVPHGEVVRVLSEAYTGSLDVG